MRGGGGYGSIVDAGPVLMALTPSSELVIFEPGAKAYSELARIKVAEGATHVIRAAPSILRGRPNDYVRPENGYESSNASVIELQIDSGFTLDGELFDADPNQKVMLDGRYTASFLRVDKG